MLLVASPLFYEQTSIPRISAGCARQQTPYLNPFHYDHQAYERVRLYYQLKGQADTTLLFIHGWNLDHTYWQNQAVEFSSAYWVVLLDLAGCGASGTNRVNWTVESFARDITSIIQKERLNNVVLVAHSMGGEIALDVAAANPQTSRGIPTMDVPGSDLTPTTASQSTMLDGLTDGINSNTNGIVLVWLLVFLLKSGQMAGGLFYIHRIKTYRTHTIPQELTQKMALFAHQIGIVQSVRLMQSEQVKVPVTVGWLRPLILLPMGSLLQLPTDQLDSILWHELAHIKRYDYLVNLVQELLETVFFFNPGLLWLSSLMRAEREACCDDLVVRKMNGKASYLEALLAFNTDDYQYFGLAMGLGSGNPLRDRINRLVTNENTRLRMAEKVVLTTGLVVLSAFLSLPKTTQLAVGSPKNGMIKKSSQTAVLKPLAIDFGKGIPVTVQQSEVKELDALPGKLDSLIQLKSVSVKQPSTSKIIHDITAVAISGKKYHLVLVGNKLVAVEINGKKVKDSDLPAYEPLIRLCRQQERAHAVDLDQKIKTDQELSKLGYMESRLGKSSQSHLKPANINRKGLKWDKLRIETTEQIENLGRMRLLVQIAELQVQAERTNENQSVKIGQLLQQLQTADGLAWKTNVK